MNRILRFAAPFIIGGVAALGMIASPAHATEPTPNLESPVEGWWLLPDGGTATNVTWSQPAIAPGAVPCGTTAQVDLYPSQSVLDTLAADGRLDQGEDYSLVISWRFVTGPECEVVPPVELPVVVEPPVVTPPTEVPVEPVTDIGTPVYVKAPAAVVPVAAVEVPRLLASTGPVTEWMFPVGLASALVGGLFLALRRVWSRPRPQGSTS